MLWLSKHNPVGQEEKTGLARFPLAVLSNTLPSAKSQRGRGEIEPIPHTWTPTKTAHPVHNRITQQNRTTDCVRNTTQKLIGRGAPHGKGVYQHSRRVQPFAVQISVRFYLDIRYKIPNFDSVTKSNKTDLWKRNQEKRPGKVEPEKVPEERLCPACTPRPWECLQ